MKISNASKKVLASALSAAMVVAFAPTIALATPSADTVKVVYDANNGQVSPSGIDDKTGVAVTKTKTAVTKTAKKYFELTETSSEAGADKSTWKEQAVAADDFTDAEWKNLLTEGSVAKGGKTYIVGDDGKVYVKDASGTKYTKALKAGDKAVATTTQEVTAATISTVNPSDEHKTYTKDGAPLLGWFIDADGDGVYDDGTDGSAAEAYAAAGSAIDVMSMAASTETVTLKARYAEMGLASASIAFASGADYIVPSAADTAKATVTATPNYLVKGNYKLVATVNGASYYSSPFTVDTDYVAGSAQTVEIPQSALTAGDIALKVINADTSADVAGATGTVTLCSVTYDAGAHGTIKDEATGASTAAKTVLTAKGTTYGQVKAAAPTVTPGTDWAGKTDGWAKADGSAVPGDSVEVKSDLTLVMQYQESGVKSVTYTEAAGIAFASNYLSTSSDLDKYLVTVSKDGVELISAKVAVNASVSGTVVFGQDYDFVSGTTYNVKAKAAAGTYTVTIAPVYKEGKTGNVKAVSKDVTVDEITYDANGAELDSKTFKPVTTAQRGVKLSDTAFSATYATGMTMKDTTKKFAGWSLDGKTVVDPAKVTVNGSVALKAVWKDALVAKPTLASATMTTSNNVDKWALTFADATEGATMTYAIAGKASGKLPAAGISGLVEGDSVTVTAKPAAGSSLESNSEVFYGYKHAVTVTPYTAFNNFALAVLNAETAESQASKRAYYSGVESVKATQAAGTAALKAVGFATQKDWEKAVTEQQRAVVAAAVAYANSEIDAKAALTKSADGKTYSFISESEAAAAKKALDQVLADFDGFAAATASKPYAAKALKADKTVLTNTAADYAQAVTYAVKSAKVSTVDAAVAEPAIAVNDAIAKLPAEVTAANAAEAKAAAEAAIAAYNELTKAQKDLVKSVDYAKATATIKAANDAIVNADEAAIAKVKGKTVKAKAKKATKSSLKVVTSESGAKSTFKKTYGNKKVTVSKSGKIVVKKGLKAGKKYTVKVKATVGTQTKTVKVIVKVAK